MWWIVGLCALPVVLAGVLVMGAGRKKVFGKRCEINPRVKIFTEADFPGLEKEPVEFPTAGGILLRGGIYHTRPLDRCRALLVFCHGMGGGHLNYATEIDHFARRGFAVLAYDNTGSVASQGDGMKGMHRSVRDLQAALRFAAGDPRLHRLPLLLAGHSWGAFAVTAGMRLPEAKEARGVVAFSGFNSYPRIIADMASGGKRPMGFLMPFAWLDEFLTFGLLGTWTAKGSLRRTETPILAVHGALDQTVLPSNSIALVLEKMERKNSRSLILPDKYHNPYVTLRGEAALRSFIEGSGALAAPGKTPVSPEKLDEFYARQDFKLMTEEDEEVMAQADRFLDDCLAGR